MIKYLVYRLDWKASVFAGCLLCCGGGISFGQSMSLEELLEVPMIEEDKAEEVLFDTASNSFIITGEMVDNLPVSTVPDLLRYAPGIHVTNSSNAIWGIGIRGMDSDFVGRTSFAVDEIDMYSSSIGSVDGMWSFLLDDISSIEIVYGPGGGLWRENSANGMVNVVRKTAFETEDTIGKYSLGNESQKVEFRSGFALGARTSARVYGKYEENDSRTIDSDGYDDDWAGSLVGARMDHRPSSDGLLTGTFEYFETDLGYSKGMGRDDVAIEQLYEMSEGFRLHGKWSQAIGSHLHVTGKGYLTELTYNTGDDRLSFQKYGLDTDANWSLTDDQSIVFGLGYEKSLYENPGREGEAEGEQVAEEIRVSIRHEWDLIKDFLKLTWGGSFQDQELSPTNEFSPTAGLAFTLSESDRLWLSWSLADKSIPSGVFVDENDSDFENEKLCAFELGYRKKIGDTDSFSINTFLYDYENVYGILVDSIEPGLGRPEYVVANVASGQSYGAEISYNKQLWEPLSISLNYSYITSDFDIGEYDGFLIEEMSGLEPEFAMENGVSPHLLSLWLNWNISRSWSADLGVRSRDWGDAQRVSSGVTTQMDLGVSWTPSERLSFSIRGRNLLDDRTNEGGIRDSFNRNSEIPRSVDLEIALKF